MYLCVMYSLTKVSEIRTRYAKLKSIIILKTNAVINEISCLLNLQELR